LRRVDCVALHSHKSAHEFNAQNRLPLTRGAVNKEFRYPEKGERARRKSPDRASTPAYRPVVRSISLSKGELCLRATFRVMHPTSSPRRYPDSWAACQIFGALFCRFTSRIGNVTNAPQTFMLDGRQYLIAATGDTLWSFVLY
jgi:hypothetical protein